MGSAPSLEGPPGPHEETEPLDLASQSDGVQVELSQADVWVLGQLIEAGTATFPPEIEDDILDGYRILKLSGYQPPPSRGHTSVEVIAGEETDEPAGTGRDLQAEASTPETGGLGAEQGVEAVIPQLRLREVLLAEISMAPPEGTEDQREPDDAVGEQARREAGSRPPGTEPLAAAVDHLADQIGGLGDGSRAPMAQERQGTVRVRRLVVDWALVGVAVTSATLLAGTAALLSDPVFVLLAVGLLGLAAFLAYPYLEGRD